MNDLADALALGGECELVRFRTGPSSGQRVDVRLRQRWWWDPWWHRGLGRSIDTMLPPVDIIHVTGLATPPTKKTPLIVSVDDLRPLRDDARDQQRVTQLRRVVRRGAQIVASSNAASAEVQRSLGLRREQVVVVPPAVPPASTVSNGSDLVVNVTGATPEFLTIATQLMSIAGQRGARVVVLASKGAAAKIKAAGIDVDVLSRELAPLALASARVVVHLSDGARFPLFTIAALAAGVPTCATATPVNRELLEGAVTLVPSDDREFIVNAVRDLYVNEPLRAVRIAAGKARASDFAPAVAARAYGALYRDVLRRSRA